MIVRERELLSHHTTFQIGGPADYYLIPESVGEVREAIEFAQEKGLSFYILGKGSNMLFPDGGYRGVIIEIGKGLEKLDIEGQKVRAQAGIAMSAMAAKLADAGLAGFEFAGGIPGTLGGGIVMNAGAYGGEIRDCIVSATVLTENYDVVECAADELELGYRSSIFQKKKAVVLGGTFSFESGKTGEIRSRMRGLNQRRREKQPLEFPSAGSTFKRPVGFFAGKLIEDAGLRGYRVGDAQVSEKHCGFVVNRGEATAKEVCQLIADVQKVVKDKFGVMLEPEVRIVEE